MLARLNIQNTDFVLVYQVENSFLIKNTAVSGDTAGETKNGCIPMPEVSHQKQRDTSAFFTRVIVSEAGGIPWEKSHKLF